MGQPMIFDDIVIVNDHVNVIEEATNRDQRVPLDPLLVSVIWIEATNTHEIVDSIDTSLMSLTMSMAM